MKTEIITKTNQRPPPDCHQHTDKRNLELINLIAGKLDACINLLQPLGSSGAWTNGLASARLAAATATEAQYDLLGIRSQIQELQDNLAAVCTPFDKERSISDALKLNTKLRTVFSREEWRQKFSDSVLHDIITDGDW